jgi:menaquinone-dependent protoporphyrinogen IX oxidase
MVIRFIMWLTGGPTERGAWWSFTDWQRVEAFGQTLRAVRVG